jgi:hypothetical protein
MTQRKITPHVHLAKQQGPASDTCVDAGTEDDRGGRDEDTCNRRGGLPMGGGGLMPGTSMC